MRSSSTPRSVGSTTSRIAAPPARSPAALGRAAPPWYAASALLLGAAAWSHRDATLGAATATWAVAIAFTLLFLAPLNARIAAWDPENPPEGWRAMRHRWDRGHAGRTLGLLAAQAVAVAALVR